MPNRFKLVNFIILSALLLLASGCTTIYNPATQRREMILINTENEIALGIDMDKQIRRELKVWDDPQMQKRLDEIGQKVATTSDRQDLKYNFKIVKDEEFNAFAIPGGFVYVNSGLIKAADDDELAAVVAHEIAHTAARHSVKRRQANLGYQLIMNIALGASGQQAVLQAVDISFNLVSLGYSRQDEFLADKLGVKYTYLSGYNPIGMVTFFQKLDKQKKPGITPPVFLSSHPPVKDRIERAKNEISLLKK
ncbi:MAG: M48 family metallopeptidase [Candidatus Omnitrophica bacterium]|nr:M48 family metallopeptidase [Candidatus Omnitrophota bacterium]